MMRLILSSNIVQSMIIFIFQPLKANFFPKKPSDINLTRLDAICPFFTYCQGSIRWHVLSFRSSFRSSESCPFVLLAMSESLRSSYRG